MTLVGDTDTITGGIPCATVNGVGRVRNRRRGPSGKWIRHLWSRIPPLRIVVNERPDSAVRELVACALRFSGGSRRWRFLLHGGAALCRARGPGGQVLERLWARLLRPAPHAVVLHAGGSGDTSVGAAWSNGAAAGPMTMAVTAAISDGGRTSLRRSGCWTPQPVPRELTPARSLDLLCESSQGSRTHRVLHRGAGVDESLKFSAQRLVETKPEQVGPR